MGLRKGSSYARKYARPYTRKSKRKAKSYIKAVPNSKIVKFKMGDITGFNNGVYPIVLSVSSNEKIQLRDASIEAVRQYLNRWVQELIGKEFYIEVKIYPHHVLRENKMITGAGADRMQTGMSRSFGKTVGRAALVNRNQVIFLVAVKTPKHEEQARKLIHSAKSRLPCGISITRITK
jgi:large subunit ribosomal protein L10e